MYGFVDESYCKSSRQQSKDINLSSMYVSSGTWTVEEWRGVA